MSMKRILTNYEQSTHLMGRLSHVVSGNRRYVEVEANSLPFSFLVSRMYLVIGYLVTILCYGRHFLAGGPRETLALYHKSDTPLP